jgi:hypothetical protein
VEQEEEIAGVELLMVLQIQAMGVMEQVTLTQAKTVVQV